MTGVNRPADDPLEERVLAALDAAGAEYTPVRIDPAHAATADFCRVYGYAMGSSANCIVVASKTGERRYAACVVLATHRLDVNRVVRRLLGVRKASFAPAEDTVALTGMLPDGVTPFGLPEDLPLYVDADVLLHERVVIGGGSRALKVEVATAAFHRLPAVEVVEGLAKPADG